MTSYKPPMSSATTQAWVNMTRQSLIKSQNHHCFRVWRNYTCTCTSRPKLILGQPLLLNDVDLRILTKRKRMCLSVQFRFISGFGVKVVCIGQHKTTSNLGSEQRNELPLKAFIDTQVNAELC